MRYRTPGEVPTAGVTAVPPALMREAEAFMATVRQALDVRVHSVWFDDRDITYRLGGGGEFRTARDESLERTLSNLEAIFNSDEFTHLEPGNFQYIDLRYGDKVFVQEELPEVATSTATSTPMEVE